MIVLYLFLSLELDTKVDSLKASLDHSVQLPTVLELNKCYLYMGKFGEGIELLRRYERYFALEEKSIVLFTIGDNFLFTGKILEARDEYLKLVNHYPHSQIANDALERLYLIETTRKDTVLLKKLAYTLFLYHTDQLHTAEDSLRNLLKTKVGAYAYYYLALLYKKKDDIPLALGALNELNNYFPEHTIHNATLFLAEIHLQSNNKKEARKILEDLIVREPTSIYGVRAREMLKQNF